MGEEKLITCKFIAFADRKPYFVKLSLEQKQEEIP
jgi:hypothetical protein